MLINLKNALCNTRIQKLLSKTKYFSLAYQNIRNVFVIKYFNKKSLSFLLHLSSTT